jgi:HprK-related kinase B
VTFPGSVRELAETWTRGVDLCGVTRLDVGGCRIDIATNSAYLAARLERYFREVLTPDRGEPDFRIVAVQADPVALGLPWVTKAPEPGKTKIKEEWVDLPDGRVVRKRLTGMVFAFGGDVHVAFGPCLANDNQVVNFVNNRYMQWRLAQGYVLLHAGAVAQGGRCLALCGPPGAGKSTTALNLLSGGLDFVTNDRLLLEASGDSVDAQGVPKHPRVNPGTILSNPLLAHMIVEPERSRLRALPADELRRLEQKSDVIIHEVFGPGRFRMQAELEALVVFNWSDRGRPSIGPADLAARLELLPMITKSPGLFYEADPRGDALDLSDARYVETLAGSRVLEVTGRQDFEAASRLCLEALDQGVATVG